MCPHVEGPLTSRKQEAGPGQQQVEEPRPLSQGLSQPSVPVGQECPVLTEALGQPQCLRPVTTRQGCGLLRAAFPSRAWLPPPLEPGGQDDEASGWHSGMGALPGLGGCREGGGRSAGTPEEVEGRGFCPLPVLVVGEAGVSLGAPNPTSCPGAGGQPTRQSKAQRGFTGRVSEVHLPREWL